MADKIDYSNPNLEEKIKDIFGDGYGKMQPLIIDILMKRNYVYKLTEEQSIQEAQRFIDNVGKIDFFEFSPGNSNCGGLAGLNNRNIEINSKYLASDMYSIFIHEMFHQLSFHFEYENDKTGETIIKNCTEENINEYYNIAEGRDEDVYAYRVEGIIEYGDQVESGRYNVGMMEAFNEAQTSLFYSHDRNLFTSKDWGYPKLTFLPHLLPSALGTTDNELFYKSGLSALEFNKLIYSKFGIDYEDCNLDKDSQSLKQTVSELMESIDYNMDIMYQIIYSRRNKIKIRCFYKSTKEII